MTYLVFNNQLRAETDATVIATLRRKGWQDAPPRPDGAEWRDGEWVVPPPPDYRPERNQRLASCDWTQLPDAPVDREAWAAYRQALRDLPETYSGTGPIPWPVAP